MRQSNDRRPRQVVRSGRGAFTLVELLVVIAIIGILVALLLPAVQSAREAARRSQCLNTVKQQALACLNYESAQGEYPAGIDHSDYPAGANQGATDGNCSTTVTNWCLEILPYLEEQALNDQFDFDKNPLCNVSNVQGGPTNRTLMYQQVPAFICPTDATPSELAGGTSQNTASIASYKGVAGSVEWAPTMISWDSTGTHPALDSDIPVDPPSFGKVRSNTRGILLAVGGAFGGGVVTSRTRTSQVTDGVSKTLLIGEYHTDLTPAVPGGALGQGVFPAQWGWANFNGFRSLGSTTSHPTLISAIDDASQALCNEAATIYMCRRTFASSHASGAITFAYGDGHVTSLLPGIDSEVYAALGTRAGGETVSEGL